METLALDPLPSAGHLVALDLQHVALDLASVPLDEVLGFRSEHGDEYRAYMRKLRQFLVELAAIADPLDRARAIADRDEELADEAHRLRDALERSYRRPLAGFALGIAGSAWTVATQDPIGGALAAAGLLLMGIPPTNERTAYSYLFSAEKTLHA